MQVTAVNKFLLRGPHVRVRDKTATEEFDTGWSHLVPQKKLAVVPPGSQAREIQVS